MLSMLHQCAYNRIVMRTTVRLSEDVHALLTAMSERAGEPMGAIIDNLVRENRTSYGQVNLRASHKVQEARAAYPSVSKHRAVVTPATIKDLQDELEA